MLSSRLDLEHQLAVTRGSREHASHDSRHRRHTSHIQCRDTFDIVRSQLDLRGAAQPYAHTHAHATPRPDRRDRDADSRAGSCVHVLEPSVWVWVGESRERYLRPRAQPATLYRFESHPQQHGNTPLRHPDSPRPHTSHSRDPSHHSSTDGCACQATIIYVPTVANRKPRNTTKNVCNPLPQPHTRRITLVFNVQRLHCTSSPVRG